MVQFGILHTSHASAPSLVYWIMMQHSSPPPSPPFSPAFPRVRCPRRVAFLTLILESAPRLDHPPRCLRALASSESPPTPRASRLSQMPHRCKQCARVEPGEVASERPCMPGRSQASILTPASILQILTCVSCRCTPVFSSFLRALPYIGETTLTALQQPPTVRGDVGHPSHTAHRALHARVPRGPTA